MKHKQKGTSGFGIIVFLVTAFVVVGALKECSAENFKRECRTKGGSPAGDSCVKSDSVIFKK